MKRVLLTGLLAIVSVFAFAQSDTSGVEEYSKGLNYRSVEEREAMMSTGFANAFSIRVPSDDRRLVRRVWKDYMQSHYNGRTKYDRKTKELVTTKAKISALGGRQSTLIGKQEKLGNTIHFTIWVENEGEMVRSARNRRQAREADMILNDFVVEIEREKTRIYLKNEQRELSKLERKLRRLQNANKRYHHEIEMARERIQRMEENIVENEAEQVQSIEKIDRQQQVVENVKENLERIN
ncbi:MAG TPA: hypothetical protein VJ953_03330 [Saprospiraceae bacterium]|nr:hypothetical protein [Saprospiraceae bacterium]